MSRRKKSVSGLVAGMISYLRYVSLQIKKNMITSLHTR